MPQFSKEGMEKNRELISRIGELAEEKDATPAQISLAWMLAKRPWIVPIPGTRKYQRLAENEGAARISLTEEEVKAIDHMLDEVPMSQVFGGTGTAKEKGGK